MFLWLCVHIMNILPAACQFCLPTACQIQICHSPENYYRVYFGFLNGKIHLCCVYHNLRFKFSFHLLFLKQNFLYLCSQGKSDIYYFHDSKVSTGKFFYLYIYLSFSVSMYINISILSILSYKYTDKTDSVCGFYFFFLSCFRKVGNCSIC